MWGRVLNLWDVCGRRKVGSVKMIEDGFTLKIPSGFLLGPQDGEEFSTFSPHKRVITAEAAVSHLTP